MKIFFSQAPRVSTSLIFAIVLLMSFNGIAAESLPQVKDQMVCHAGKVLTVLNKNYSKKSLTCMKRSTQDTHNYNNLADVYSEGWFVVDINNSDTWVFNK
ncbi:MAG: hypothetical protein GQ572_03345 [Gammaproteobacteria bacterium]|jgi:hypothetical protein|nr:hypothetical protein [Gammaproteobacteria bacterium]